MQDDNRSVATSRVCSRTKTTEPMDIEEEGSVERNMDFEDVTEDGLEEAVSQQAPMLPAPACFSTHTAWPALIIPPSQLTAPPTLAPPTHRPCGASKHSHMHAGSHHTPHSPRRTRPTPISPSTAAARAQELR